MTVGSFSLREKAGMRGLKSLIDSLTLTLSLRERGSADFWLKHHANQLRFYIR
jgi:hypothetical protein